MRTTPEGLKETLHALEDFNSSRPEIRDFLEKKRMINVRDLDAEGLKELEQHLRDVLKLVTSPPLSGKLN